MVRFLVLLLFHPFIFPVNLFSVMYFWQINFSKTEVRESIRRGVWNREKLNEFLDADLVDHITSNINPVLQEEADVAWWMHQSNGKFISKSVFRCLRSKKVEIWWMENIWIKGIPFKICFFQWRVWKRRVDAEDNLKRMKVCLASRCYYYENRGEEIMSYLF